MCVRCGTFQRVSKYQCCLRRTQTTGGLTALVRAQWLHCTSARDAPRPLRFGPVPCPPMELRCVAEVDLGQRDRHNLARGPGGLTALGDAFWRSHSHSSTRCMWSKYDCGSPRTKLHRSCIGHTPGGFTALVRARWLHCTSARELTFGLINNLYVWMQ